MSSFLDPLDGITLDPNLVARAISFARKAPPAALRAWPISVLPVMWPQPRGDPPKNGLGPGHPDDGLFLQPTRSEDGPSSPQQQANHDLWHSAIGGDIPLIYDPYSGEGAVLDTAMTSPGDAAGPGHDLGGKTTTTTTATTTATMTETMTETMAAMPPITMATMAAAAVTAALNDASAVPNPPDHGGASNDAYALADGYSHDTAFANAHNLLFDPAAPIPAEMLAMNLYAPTTGAFGHTAHTMATFINPAAMHMDQTASLDDFPADGTAPSAHGHATATAAHAPADDARPSGLESFARLKFADGTFFMTTYAVIIGRDQLAIEQARRDQRQGGSGDGIGVGGLANGLPTTFQDQTDLQPTRKKFSRSYISEEGGFVGPEADDDPAGGSSGRPAKRRKTHSSGSGSGRGQGQNQGQGQAAGSGAAGGAAAAGDGNHDSNGNGNGNGTAGDTVMAEAGDIVPDRQYIAGHTPNSAMVDIETHQPSPDRVAFIGIHSPGPDMLAKTKAISRRHLRIAFNFRKGVFEATPLHLNGFFHNDTYVRDLPVVLRSGDVLQIKDIAFSFVISSVKKGFTGAERNSGRRRGVNSTGGKQMSFEFESHHEGNAQDTSEEEPVAAAAAAVAAEPPAKGKGKAKAKKAPKTTQANQTSQTNQPAAARPAPPLELPMPDAPLQQGNSSTPAPIITSVEAESTSTSAQLVEMGLTALPRKRGPGRPPKNGIMSLKDTKKLLKEVATGSQTTAALAAAAAAAAVHAETVSTAGLAAILDAMQSDSGNAAAAAAVAAAALPLPAPPISLPLPAPPAAATPAPSAPSATPEAMPMDLASLSGTPVLMPATPGGMNMGMNMNANMHMHTATPGTAATPGSVTPGGQPAVPAKRKVGRPRKYPLPEGGEQPAEKRKYKPRKPKNELPGDGMGLGALGGVPNHGQGNSGGGGNGNGDSDSGDGNGGGGHGTDVRRTERHKTPPLVLDRAHFSAEQLAKPNKNYSVLIDEVLLAAPEGLTLKQVYKRIQMRYPYFFFEVETKGWESSVRHNLIGNFAFAKIEESQRWFRVANMSLEEGKRLATAAAAVNAEEKNRPGARVGTAGGPGTAAVNSINAAQAQIQAQVQAQVQAQIAAQQAQAQAQAQQMQTTQQAAQQAQQHQQQYQQQQVSAATSPMTPRALSAQPPTTPSLHASPRASFSASHTPPGRSASPAVPISASTGPSSGGVAHETKMLVRNFKAQVLKQAGRLTPHAEEIAMSVVNRRLGLATVSTAPTDKAGAQGTTPAGDLETIIYRVFDKSLERQLGGRPPIDPSLLAQLLRSKDVFMQVLQDKMGEHRGTMLILSAIDQALGFTDRSMMRAAEDEDQAEMRGSEGVILEHIRELIAKTGEAAASATTPAASTAAAARTAPSTPSTPVLAAAAPSVASPATPAPTTAV